MNLTRTSDPQPPTHSPAKSSIESFTDMAYKCSPAHRRSAGQSDGSGGFQCAHCRWSAFPAAVAELIRRQTLVMIRLNRLLVIASVSVLIGLCGCGGSKPRSLSNNRVLLQPSLAEKERLLARMGFTNIVTHGAVERDSTGTRIFVSVETGNRSNLVQQLRTQQLVVVTAEGARTKPWHFPANERVTDDGEVAVWQHPQPDYRWEVRSGEVLPEGCNVEDVSGNWIALTAPGRAPWIAKLDTPKVVVAELSDSPGLISIFAKDQVVHVFARRGWRNEEGEMKYVVYDFGRSSAKPLRELTIPWARIALDMDPETGCAVLNDNSKFWGRTWLLDLRTGKRKSISMGDWTVIVRKEVAEKWIQLTKP